jgi:hypothetical protein
VSHRNNQQKTEKDRANVSAKANQRNNTDNNSDIDTTNSLFNFTNQDFFFKTRRSVKICHLFVFVFIECSYPFLPDFHTHSAAFDTQLFSQRSRFCLDVN